MMGFSGGMSGGTWILMGLFGVALIVFIVWMVIGMVAEIKGVPTRASSRPATDSPTDLLSRRLAIGDVHTYEELKTALARTH